MPDGPSLDVLHPRYYFKNNIMKSQEKIIVESSGINNEKKRITWTEHKRQWKLTNKYEYQN